MKNKAGKTRFDLVPWRAVDALARVMTFGAGQYPENSWREVDPKDYEAALMRHAVARMTGQQFNPDSGLDHWAHVMANAAFLFEILNHQEKPEGSSNR